MMDLKEIIKWFIPCFHILLGKFSRKMDVRLTIFVFLFLLFNFAQATAIGGAASDTFLRNRQNSFNSSFSDNATIHQSDLRNATGDERSLDNGSGRTFGRPFKKMIAGLLPIIFQLGAATAWAAVGTLVAIKTLLVTLAILKLLLLAGAVKVGALFAKKEHHQHKEWSPQKEVHLHIHNGGHQAVGHEEHYGPWSREGVPITAESKPAAVGVPFDPYSGPQEASSGPQVFSGPQIYTGPQTISTPYGNYVKVGTKRKREIRMIRRK